MRHERFYGADGHLHTLVPGCSGSVRQEGDEWVALVTYPDGTEVPTAKRYGTEQEARRAMVGVLR